MSESSRAPSPQMIAQAFTSHGGEVSRQIGGIGGEATEKGCWTFGLPQLSQQCSERWIGSRMIWWPAGIPKHPQHAIVSSRIRRQREEETIWFGFLRCAVDRIASAKGSVILVPGTAAEKAVRQAAKHWNVATIEYSLVEADAELATAAAAARWAERISGQSHHAQAVLSPELVFAGPTLEAAQPLRDRLLFAAADQITILCSRPGGITAELKNRHLADSERQVVWILQAQQPGSMNVPESAQSGVIPWLVHTAVKDVQSRPPLQSEPIEVGRQVTEQTHRKSKAQTHDVFLRPEAWLLHWTRAIPGPWCGQTEEDWLDELVFNTAAADHSAFATLCRIVRQRTLRASNQGIRGGYRVVSWTAVPLSEFRHRRTWQRHRQRYDFELRGIGVHRSQLIRLGARPVVYGPVEQWNQLAEIDRPWFQKAGPEVRLNTRAEREWRVVGDVDLQRLSTAEICLFVENSEEKQRLQSRTDWPVVVVPPGQS
ncbi:MAG: hypothetical protein KDA85_11020 [Planctomycetaceae bacterium]|nr:hypothetical protein [Planctomycetaceae bacterium]